VRCVRRGAWVRRRDAPACGELSTSRHVWLYGASI